MKRHIIQGIRWVYENNFREDVIQIISDFKNDLTCVATDDCIIYRGIPEEDRTCIYDLMEKPDMFAFSLGVGKNARYSQSVGVWFDTPPFTHYGDILVWNWKGVTNRSEFSCPFIFCGNIVRKSELLSYINMAGNFSKPNSLESQLQWLQQTIRNTMPDNCACLEHSIMVHSANNRVQEEFQTASGTEYPEDVDNLNSLYMSGQIIDVDNLNFDNVAGLHKEIKFVFKLSE
jgi:hypothetical protein